MNENTPRVIFVNRVYWPSTEATAQLLTDLAEGLATEGWKVEVIATGHDPATERRGVRIHRTGAGEQHGGLLSRALNFRRFQSAAARHVAAIAQAGDVVVAMTDPPLLASHVATACARTGARLVCWVQDIYPEIAVEHFGPLLGTLTSPMQRRRNRAWRGAAACVTLGDAMRRTLQRNGADQRSLRVIPNWAPRELHRLATPEEISSCRRRWDVEGRFVVAYSGNLGRVHEFDTVLEAAARLRDLPAVVFVLVGRGARFDQVAREVRVRKLENVVFLPPEPRALLAAALGAADAHLVTLRTQYSSYVYPSKLAGVLAAARPVLYVGPLDVDIAELIDEAPCGTCFTPGDVRGLADTIRRWQAEPSATRALGARGRTAYERAFTFTGALAAWERCLRSAAIHSVRNLPWFSPPP